MSGSVYSVSAALTKMFLSQSRFSVKVNYECFMAKRWAGHSKWGNIKHTKQLKDHVKSMNIQRLVRKIGLAVKEGGENPKGNSKLQQLIHEAHKISMSASSVQKAIKNATATAKPTWIFFGNPSGLVMAFETVSPNLLHFRGKLAQHTKKLMMKYEGAPNNVGVEKGIIISEPLNIENSYEKALEDALEVGIEDVTENEDKTLVFECLPNVLEVAHQKLEAKGYKIQSASTEIIFHNYIQVTKNEMEIINIILQKIESANEELLRVAYNIEVPDK